MNQRTSLVGFARRGRKEFIGQALRRQKKPGSKSVKVSGASSIRVRKKERARDWKRGEKLIHLSYRYGLFSENRREKRRARRGKCLSEFW